MSDSAPVSVSSAGDGGCVAVVEIDDGKANALSTSIIAAVKGAIADAEADESKVAVVVAGREGFFSGGFDLDVIRSGDASAIVELVSSGGDLVRTFYGCGLPVVAACTGHAVAAGALMLLGSDVRVGAEGPYKVGLNEVAIGLTLPGWALTVAGDRLSKRHLQRSILNARLTDAPGAVDVGFLDRVVPADEVLATAVAEGEALAALDRNAYRGTIAAFRQPTLDAMDAAIAADRARTGG